MAEDTPSLHAPTYTHEGNEAARLGDAADATKQSFPSYAKADALKGKRSISRRHGSGWLIVFADCEHRGGQVSRLRFGYALRS
jgi:hypothetical protein